MKKKNNVLYIVIGLGLAAVVTVAVGMNSQMFQGYLNFSNVKQTNVKPAQVTLSPGNLKIPLRQPPAVMTSAAGLSNTLNNGSLGLYKWQVVTPPWNDVAIKQFAFDVNVTGAAGLTLGDFRLFENGSDISSQSSIIDILENGVGGVEPTEGTIVGPLSTVVLVQWRDARDVGEKIIPKGQTTTYTLRATVSGFTGDVDESVSITLNNDSAGEHTGVLTDGSDMVEVATFASSFVWSNLSGSPHSSQLGASSSDWMNGYSVRGLAEMTPFILQ